MIKTNAARVVAKVIDNKTFGNRAKSLFEDVAIIIDAFFVHADYRSTVWSG